jgi:hypothetical protein
MGDEDLYVGNVRTYYNTQSIILSSNERPSLKACSSSFPDGNSCLYQFDTRHCCVPDFGEVVQCNAYVDKKDFYKHSSRRIGYIIPYNFPLNTRRGFRTIYYLMKLSQHDMTTVIKDIIAVRHAGINFILNICDKLEKENNRMLTSLRGG